MNHIPKYQPEYSASKLDAWQRDYERLQGKMEELQAQLGELVNSDGYQKEVAALVAQLVTKRDGVKREGDKVKDTLLKRRTGAVQAAIDNQDVLKLVEELDALEKKEVILARSYQYISDAIAKVER